MLKTVPAALYIWVCPFLSEGMSESVFQKPCEHHISKN